MDHPPETTSLLHHFAALKDPRQLVKVVCPLPEILLLVLCATIVGADDFVEVNTGAKRTWSPCAASCPTRTAYPATTR
jgi:hypothetical protein